MSLQSGQVIRYDNSLWRVDYVNECRARIIPLVKRHVTLADGREFESEQRGVNISANAEVALVDNIDAERTRLELAQAEAELAAAKRELEAETRRLAQAETAHAPKAEPAKNKPQAAQAYAKPMPSGGIGWRLGSAQPEHLREGSLKRWVFDFVAAHPGQTTKTVAEGVKASKANASAVAACLDRFRKINVLKKD